MNWRGWLAALFVMLALAGCSQGTTGQAGTPYPPYLTTGMRPSTAEEMVAVAVCSWPGVGTVAHVLGPADPLNAGAAAGFKVDLG
jgi:hypothetical protein